MKKILFIITLCLLGFVQPSSAAVPSDYPLVNGMIKLPCIQDDGLATLFSIYEKCNKENVDVSVFTQKEYDIMITFSNQLLDAAEAYDAAGESDIFMENVEDQMNLVVAFGTFLSNADEEGLLNAANKANFQKLLVRFAEADE